MKFRSSAPVALAACVAAQALAQSVPPIEVVKHDPNPSTALLGPCPPGPGVNLCIPLDGTFSVVTFDGVGGNGPANPTDPCQRNDDDVTLAVNLQFTFDLFGQTWNQVYINNNGNISFGASFSTFTATGFPVNGFPMVAPFWADVDTRNTASGVVHYVSLPHRFTVIWDGVGYYSSNAGLLNTFELSISDGTDPAVGIGQNVCFCYGDMQWTTGDASGGTGGFGGTPATVGVNKGDGVNFFQLGLFGVAGGAYDGPSGNIDGIDYLDGTQYCFDVSQVGNNVAPVFLNPPTGCIAATVGTLLTFDIQAIGPENSETVTLTVNTNGLANFTHVETPGNPAVSHCTFTPASTQLGQQQLVFTATDNGTPPATSVLNVCLDVSPVYTTYCYGDGTANGGPDCPCANSLAGNTAGCLNSTGVGADLHATGIASISGDTLTLTVDHIIPNKPTYFFGSASQAGSGLGLMSGDGLLCIGAPRQKVGKLVAAPASGTMSVPLTGDPPLSVQFPPTAGATQYYQVIYRNQGGPCGNGFNYSNGVGATWLP